MKRLKLSCKFATQSFTILITLLLNFSYANAANLDLEKMCDRQSILISEKLNTNSKKELTKQDMNMIRIGAVHGCRATYKKMIHADEFVESSSSDQTAVIENGVENNQDNNKKESIFDRLLRTKPKKDVNPMQKKHRTGGK